MAHPYATVADMILRFREDHLNGFEGVTIVADADDTLQEFLNMSSREMDGYFEQYGYTVPLSPSTPGRAKDLCLIIAYYWLVVSDPEIKDPSESVVDNYTNAIAWLQKLADKEVSLGTGLDVETDSDALDIAEVALGLDDMSMTDGNSIVGTDRNSLDGFALNDDESGAE